MKPGKNKLRWLLPAGLLFAHGLFLGELGISWLHQVSLLGIAFLMVSAGAAFLGKARGKIDDPAARIAFFFTAGLATFTLFNLVLYHLPASWPQVPLNLIFLGAAALAGARKLGKISGKIRAAPLAVASLLALALAAGTFDGVYNNPGAPFRWHSFRFDILVRRPRAQNWGWNCDKRAWLLGFTRDLEAERLPPKLLYHNGVPALFLSLARFAGGPDQAGIMAAYKTFGPLLAFSLLAIFAWLARAVFGLPDRWAAAAVGAVAFFGAINLRIVPGGPWWDSLFRLRVKSSYLGFFPAGAGLYHNVTFFLGLLVGGAGFALALKALRGEKDLLLPGCALLAASFIFKPSLYSVVLAPLFLGGILDRKLGVRKKLAGGFILLLPVLFWIFYPRVFGIPAAGAEIVFAPFRVIFIFLGKKMAGAGPVLAAAVVTVLSFAALLPVLADGLSRRVWRGCGRPGWWRERLPETVTVLAFLAGTASFALLAQGGEMLQHGNLSWGAASGYVLLLPLLVKWIRGIPSPWLRLPAWGLFLLQVWAGFQHFYMFVFHSRI